MRGDQLARQWRILWTIESANHGVVAQLAAERTATSRQSGKISPPFRPLVLPVCSQDNILRKTMAPHGRRFPAACCRVLQNWRSQFVTSNRDKMGLRHKPMAFTEQGQGSFGRSRDRAKGSHSLRSRRLCGEKDS